MSETYPAAKRARSGASASNKLANSVDVYNDANFLTKYINVNDNVLRLLLSGRVISGSFSELFQRSREIGWMAVFVEERQKLKLQEKLKSRRIMLNRLIDECLQDANGFEKKVQALNDEISSQVFPKLPTQKQYGIYFPTINHVYEYIEEWKQRQCQRRLFYRECNNLPTLLILQQQMTNQFLELFNIVNYDANFFKSGGKEAFIELFRYSFIIVAQPSGTDCVAATKYEKIGQDFLAKIKTRIICLLDLKKIRSYLQYSHIDVVLYPTGDEVGLENDIQAPIQWKSRTITTSDKEEQTFFYAELTENDSIKLTKKDSRQKPLYNSKLCQLEFRITLNVVGHDVESLLILNSQSFGLCSHPKYYPKHVAKVLIEEVNQWQLHVNIETHITTLIGYISQLYQRITGVEAKPHTLKVIEEELLEVFNSHSTVLRSCTEPHVIYPWGIYQNILERLIVQIKFLGSNPFLAMMYHDSLFYGICSDKVDSKIANGTAQAPQIIMRFEQFKTQDAQQHPKIIFAVNAGTLLKARASHETLIDDICRCIDKAEKNERNHSQIFTEEELIPFSHFRRYYDKDLNRDNLIQTDEQTIFHSLSTILQHTM
ncbi:unnamed protein product [Rotaria magnacalcarata]|uniref:Uncharacterized protein n=5 Tax=Rotaria magnacalcarata TaxID=392030 RepID=A0A816DV64_9BILA|nr:unnamed protein product [Rotaria magnacalcarata]